MGNKTDKIKVCETVKVSTNKIFIESFGDKDNYLEIKREYKDIFKIRVGTMYDAVDEYHIMTISKEDLIRFSNLIIEKIDTFI